MSATSFAVVLGLICAFLTKSHLMYRKQNKQHSGRHGDITVHWYIIISFKSGTIRSLKSEPKAEHDNWRPFKQLYKKPKNKFEILMLNLLFFDVR